MNTKESTIQWEKVTYATFNNARYADVGNVRLYVKRRSPRERVFIGYINGKSVGGWDTIHMACSQVAAMYRKTQC